MRLRQKTYPMGQTAEERLATVEWLYEQEKKWHKQTARSLSRSADECRRGWAEVGKQRDDVRATLEAERHEFHDLENRLIELVGRMDADGSAYAAELRYAIRPDLYPSGEDAPA